MPTCEIITVGSELLDGSVLNSNAQFLAERVTSLHIEVVHQVACRDREHEILDALNRAFRRSQLIFVTGGLGPTPDDITREAIAHYFGCGLKFHPEQYRQIVKYFRSLHRETPGITRREAYLPTVAKPLINRFGIALGFFVMRSGRLLVVLPGVPRELMKIYDTCVNRLIQNTFRDRPVRHLLVAKILALNEPQIMRRLGRRFFRDREFDFGIYPHIGETTIRIKSKQKRLVSRLARELKQRLSGFIYAFQDQSISTVIGRALLQRRLSLAIAESCTGGLLAKQLTDVPGASRYFKGGTVAYSDAIKCDHLGVSQESLLRYGAVSKQVAAAMAAGARIRCGASLGMSVTGIAGPGGGSRRKPVGLVYIAISSKDETRTVKCQFSGDRSKIRARATASAFHLLWRWLRN